MNFCLQGFNAMLLHIQCDRLIFLQRIPLCIDARGRLSCTLRQKAFVEKQLLAAELKTD